MRCPDPYMVKNSLGEKVPVGCGRCHVCKRKRINNWIFRLQQEDKRASSAYFVTLTYDTKHVPISQNGYMTLRKTDVQKYMKRVRFIEKGNKAIKYYLCGEYGGKKGRPHYHAIIFNIQDVETLEKAWTLNGSLLGGIYTGTVTGKSIAYTCKYLDKEKKIPVHRRDDRKKEFTLMSKGLGSNFLTPQMKNYYRSDLTRNYVRTIDGYTSSLPKYYRDNMLDENERAEQGRLMEKAEQDQLQKQYWMWWNLYGIHGADFSFDQYMDTKRIHGHTQFYNRQKLNSRHKHDLK